MMGIMRGLGFVMQVLILLPPGIIFMLVGANLPPSTDGSVRLTLIIIGSVWLLISLMTIWRTLWESARMSTQARLESALNFNAQTLKANRAGRMTRQQKRRILINNALVSVGATIIGIACAVAALGVWQTPDREMRFFIMFLFLAIISIAFAVRKYAASRRDLRDDVQVVTGTLALRKIKREVHTASRGSRFRTGYRLVVRDNTGQTFTFPVLQVVYEALRENRQDERYHIYYLPSLNLLLSLELAQT